MIATDLSAPHASQKLLQRANQALTEADYALAARLYEQLVEQQPEEKSHIWYYGLSLMLQGQEAEAQTAWLLGMAEGEPEEIEQWTADLVQLLHTEADRLERGDELTLAWMVRQHIREMAPCEVNNLLRLVLLNLKRGEFCSEDLTDSGLTELLQSEETAVDQALMLETFKQLFEAAFLNPDIFPFAEACLKRAEEPIYFIDALLSNSVQVGHIYRHFAVAARMLEMALDFHFIKVELLRHLLAFYLEDWKYTKAIETAQECYDLSQNEFDRLYANHLMIKCLTSPTGYWKEACEKMTLHQELLRSFLTSTATSLDAASTCRLFTTPFFLPYFSDDAVNSRLLTNQVSAVCQQNTRLRFPELTQQFQQGIAQRRTSCKTRKLKIGYLSYCLKQHSVGWLCRWLFQHHDRERFEINLYLLGQTLHPFTEHWFTNHADRVHVAKGYDASTAEQIYKDEVDILIELDSLTLDSICEVLSLKPAPIQVSWLGWDAPGLPAIDYFLADPYVLPDNAQDYYSEKIWRLPETYIAVDGFEVGVPSLRRDQLDLPEDAVTYLVVQRGYKRHPDNVRQQMRILKNVPNGYLLIKGMADPDSSKRFYEEMAEAEGVSSDRLRFLPFADGEATHRANLSIADVMLDTFPYNGATTTLETLWVGVPLVTQVGQQFSARNSYTMMVNAGITEGIAHSEDEYVEWGVRLGKDAALRQQITWKLRQSRNTAPLWNAKKFTREMEQAYEQMWQRFLEQS